MTDKEFIDAIYKAAELDHLKNALPRESVVDIFATWRRLIDALKEVQSLLGR